MERSKEKERHMRIHSCWVWWYRPLSCVITRDEGIRGRTELRTSRDVCTRCVHETCARDVCTCILIRTCTASR